MPCVLSFLRSEQEANKDLRKSLDQKSSCSECMLLLGRIPSLSAAPLMMETAEVEVPSYFLCPISLEIMRDPVTLPTGITYDRSSIEQWICSGLRRKGGGIVCPVTKQLLPAADRLDLTPNHTLRRLIQAWCTLNSAERFPTPRSPVDDGLQHVARLVEDAAARASPRHKLRALRKMKAMVSEDERGKRCVEAAPGALDFLASVITDYSSSSGDEEVSARDEALVVLHSLQASEDGLLSVVANNVRIVESLAAILRRSSCQSRSYAMLVLKDLFGVMAPARLAGVDEGTLGEIVRTLGDRVSAQATKAALQSLVAVCPWGRNRVKAVAAGAVHALVELLLEEPERRPCELALAAMDVLCGCAEGRAALAGHAAGVAVVSKKVLRMSQLASEKGVRVLHSLAKHSAAPALLQEMAQVGAVDKLCLVLQVQSTPKAKEKAREILRLHSRVWKCSQCLAPQFKNSYP